ncbi:hypothetical protein Rhal01_00915 [Rubritalea halochordaticola]|uniref:Na+/H+ antiporter NhaC-like C-terminal domain-containing protein n=1 Tax=Rubritalea halochordaticola TaxID=714537 RepID=A0ABP9V0Y9_9BACT
MLSPVMPLVRKYQPAITLCLLLLISWVLSATTQSTSIAALWPAFVALATIIASRQAVAGLFAGALSGCLFLTHGNLGQSFISLTESHFFASMQGSWRIGAILFTLVLGSFAMVLEKGGGFESLALRLLEKKSGNPARKLEGTTMLMGLLCFFDGLANSLLLGKVTQPLADRVGVPRVRMAYLVDSTSSSVACIAFISTWIATQLSLIQQSTEGTAVTESAYTLFFQSIPANYYCTFTLILLALVIWMQWNIGPMKNAAANEPATSHQSSQTGSSIHTAIIPIIVLACAILSLFYLWETSPLFPVTADKLTTAFSSNAGPYALTLGSVIGLAAACILFPNKSKIELPSIVSQGASSMLSPLLILIMAWTFGSVMKELGTAQWLADTIGSTFSVQYFPAAIFITGALVSFTTGSSWGTMALLMPIAIPAYLTLTPESYPLLPAVIGAVFSGAVFGDHCSPFSDTTIVSSFACGVSPREHVLTQLPYALIAAGTALALGYTGIAIGFSSYTALLAGAAFLIILVNFCSKKRSS